MPFFIRASGFPSAKKICSIEFCSIGAMNMNDLKKRRRKKMLLKYILIYNMSSKKMAKVIHQVVNKFFFQILWKSRCNILVSFPYHLKIVIFYTEILTGKVVLWCFFSSKIVKKCTIHLFMSKSQYRT